MPRKGDLDAVQIVDEACDLIELWADDWGKGDENYAPELFAHWLSVLFACSVLSGEGPSDWLYRSLRTAIVADDDGETGEMLTAIHLTLIKRALDRRGKE